MRITSPAGLTIAAVALLTLAAATARTSNAQAPGQIVLDLEDYAAMPITGELDGANTRGLLARVNYLRDEPGGRRFFVNDLNGPLYILDKRTKAFTTYLDFNGLAGRPGLFPKFTFERNFATGLTSFIFDPDYTTNGIFYTLHMEDPSTAAPAEPRSGVVPGLDLSAYQVSTPITVPTDDGQISREVVLIEWRDRNTANTTFEGTARELMRVQHPLPQHPLGEMTFNPTAALRNPVPSTPASIARGKDLYDLNCAACHGPQAEGAVRAGVAISIIEEARGKQPPDLTDAQWDHGSTDVAVLTAIKQGVPPTMMAGYDGRIADPDIWHLINYIRSLAR
jgi:mono/diheme cytochrome c family protein